MSTCTFSLFWGSGTIKLFKDLPKPTLETFIIYPTVTGPINSTLLISGICCAYTITTEAVLPTSIVVAVAVLAQKKASAHVRHAWFDKSQAVHDGALHASCLKFMSKESGFCWLCGWCASVFGCPCCLRYAALLVSLAGAARPAQWTPEGQDIPAISVASFDCFYSLYLLVMKQSKPEFSRIATSEAKLQLAGKMGVPST